MKARAAALTKTGMSLGYGRTEAGAESDRNEHHGAPMSTTTPSGPSNASAAVAAEAQGSCSTVRMRSGLNEAEVTRVRNLTGVWRAG